jgi:hypothetical protein
MRSPTFTLLLLILTLAIAGVATVSISEGNLNRLFGKPVAQEGDRLYTFDPNEVYRIRLNGNGSHAECVFEDKRWRIVSPWNDRMDPRFADAILLFTLGTRVVDAIPKGKLESAQSLDNDGQGLKDGITAVRIENKSGKALAQYFLGKQTAFRSIDDKGVETPTVLVRPVDKNRKDSFTYACTGDINPIFKDGFRSLRDHHPFYFNPLVLETIRINNAEGEMTLSQTAPESKKWRIVKPQELRTDPAAVATLLHDLVNLRAIRVSNRAEVTLPPAEAGKGETIALKYFGQSTETIFEISPPASANAETVHATISDRPEAVFELNLKPLAADPAGAKSADEDDMIAIANLPDTVNELRNQALTNIDGASLAGIMISPSTGAPIALVRESPTSDFKVQIGETLEQPNLDTLQRLLVAITKTKVVRFMDDAATDMSIYGLDSPSLVLRFASFSTTTDDGFQLAFGQGRDGTWYETRVGSTTVVKIDDNFIHQIAVHPWEWRNTTLWSISPVDLSSFTRKIGDHAPLILKYNFGAQSWTADDNGKDRTAEIDKARADHILDALLGLKAAVWLSPDDEAANKALEKPLMIFQMVTNTVDNEGQVSGIRNYELRVAPSANYPTVRKFYGRYNGDFSPFLLNEADVRNLGANLFGE